MITDMKTIIRNSFVYKPLSLFRELVHWGSRSFASPSPQFIKQSCLVRNGIAGATWVETGTFLGATTQLLSKHAPKVYSIEPEPTLYANARAKFENMKNVEIIKGTSEDVFPTLLSGITGNVNFWLDGHYSAGITFRGHQETPIADELDQIGKHLAHFGKLVVLIDDVRCFNPNVPEYATYPSLDFLVDWARTNHLHWHIEHDIFVAKNFSA